MHNSHNSHNSSIYRAKLAAALAAALIAGLASPAALAQTPASMPANGSDARSGQVDASAPDALIRSMSDDILQTVKNDPAVKAGDVRRITELVNQKILPHADFARTTRLAMGPYWRQASPAQQSELVKQFELLLIHTYAGATAKVGDQTVEVKPLRAAPDDTDVVVHTNVISQGRPYPVDYRLEKTADGWKIYDVNVLGAWLIQAYRQQFAGQIAQQGIGGLLAFLTERNRQLAGASAD